MSDDSNRNAARRQAEAEKGSCEPAQPNTASRISYILQQLEKIQSQTDYLYQAIDAMRNGGVGDGVGIGAGNLVEEREKTNRQLIAFYEKIYDDLKASRISE